jgi:hypothetical protein
MLLYAINNVAAMGITVSWSGHRGHLGTLPIDRNAPRGQAAASGRFSLFEPGGEFENRMEASRLQGKVPGVGAKEMVILIAASTYNRHNISSFQCFI